MREARRLAVAAFAVLVFAAIRVGVAQETVTAAAIWRPGAGFLARFHAQCDGRGGAAFDACFAAAMAKAGASKAALDFTASLGNQADLEALDATGGPIAIAHVIYPFRANENDAWLLVNGTPPLTDVDDRRNLAFPQMRSSAAYAEIHRQYPNVTFWPGDRGASGPQAAHNGQEIIVGYLLRNLCHACAIVGRVRYAFEFDAGGKLLGTRLAAVTPIEK